MEKEFLIAVSGYNGFLGFHICESLKRIKENRIILLEKNDFNNLDILSQKVKKSNLLIHLAAINRHSDESYLYDNNVKLSLSLVNILEKLNRPPRVIFASSTQESEGTQYGNAKLKCRKIFENWAINNNADLLSFIIPNVFGPFCKPLHNSFISTFCMQIINNEEPKIIIDKEVKLIYIADLVDLIQKHLNRAKWISKIILIENVKKIKVSEVLELLKYFHKSYIKESIFPNLKTQFMKDLFITYHSSIKKNSDYPRAIKKHVDDRGFYSEVYKSGSKTQVSYSATNSGIIRGNHYHTRKIERFIVLNGEALIEIRKIGSNKIHKYVLTGDSPKYIDMPVFYTHSIKNIGNTDLITIFCINEFYDIENPDTFYEKVQQ